MIGVNEWGEEEQRRKKGENQNQPISLVAFSHDRFGSVSHDQLQHSSRDLHFHGNPYTLEMTPTSR